MRRMRWARRRSSRPWKGSSRFASRRLVGTPCGCVAVPVLVVVILCKTDGGPAKTPSEALALAGRSGGQLRDRIPAVAELGESEPHLASGDGGKASPPSAVQRGLDRQGLRLNSRGQTVAVRVGVEVSSHRSRGFSEGSWRQTILLRSFLICPGHRWGLPSFETYASCEISLPFDDVARFSGREVDPKETEAATSTLSASLQSQVLDHIARTNSPSDSKAEALSPPHGQLEPATGPEDQEPKTDIGPVGDPSEPTGQEDSDHPPSPAGEAESKEPEMQRSGAVPEPTSPGTPRAEREGAAQARHGHSFGQFGLSRIQSTCWIIRYRILDIIRYETRCNIWCVLIVCPRRCVVYRIIQ